MCIRDRGYGVDKNVQAPTILTNAGFDCTLIGKVADIVANDGGASISCVPTEEVMRLTVQAVKSMEEGFICTNVQETDLAGHSQSAAAYREILEIAYQGTMCIRDSKNTGDRIQPISEYQEKFGVSRGTVQNAFTYLKECGAVAVSYTHLRYWSNSGWQAY